MEQCGACDRLGVSSRGKYLRVYRPDGNYAIRWVCWRCSLELAWMRVGTKWRIGIMVASGLLGAALAQLVSHLAMR
jgi:hypothetical protein